MSSKYADILHCFLWPVKAQIQTSINNNHFLHVQAFLILCRSLTSQHSQESNKSNARDLEMFCLKVCFHFYSGVCRCLWRLEQCWIPGAGVPDSSRPQDVCVGNQTVVLCKSRERNHWSLLIHRIYSTITGKIPKLSHIGEKYK